MTDGRDYSIRVSGERGLYASFDGARIKAMQDDAPRLHIEQRHPTATDAEHQQAIVGRLVIEQSGVETLAEDGSILFSGTLTQAQLYPAGTDPVTGTCGRCQIPHPLAESLPPLVEDRDLPLAVHIECEALP